MASCKKENKKTKFNIILCRQKVHTSRAKYALFLGFNLRT